MLVKAHFANSTLKQQFISLATQQGYLRTVRAGRGLSLFIIDILNNVVTRNTNVQPHNQRIFKNLSTRVFLELPFIIADEMPKYLCIPPYIDWDYILTDLATGSLRPESYPTILTQPRQPHASPFDTEPTYKLFVSSLVPSEPEPPTLHYIDNRPLDNMDGIIGPPSLPAWHITSLSRSLKLVALPNTTVDALLDIARHHSIFPLHSRTLNGVLSHTLEAIYHNLLIPTPQESSDVY